MVFYYKLTYVGVCGDSCGPLPCEECWERFEGPTICKCCDATEDALDADDADEPADAPDIVAVKTGRPGLKRCVLNTSY